MRLIVLHLFLLSYLADFIQETASDAEALGVEYTVYNNTRGWLDAYTVCTSSGGHLLEVRDDIDFNVLQNMTRTDLWESTMSGMFWLGMYRSRLTNTFKWSTCDDLGNTTFWEQEGELNVTGNACVSVDPKSLLWNTSPCSTQLPFVCQQDVGSCTYTDLHISNCTHESATRLKHKVKDESSCREKCDLVFTPEGQPCWAYYIFEQSCVTLHSSDPFLCDKKGTSIHTMEGYLAIRKCFTLTMNTTTLSETLMSTQPRYVCLDDDFTANSTRSISVDSQNGSSSLDAYSLDAEDQTPQTLPAEFSLTLNVTASLLPDHTLEGGVTLTSVESYGDIPSDMSIKPMSSTVAGVSVISVDDLTSEQVLKERETIEIFKTDKGQGDGIQLQPSSSGNDLTGLEEKTMNTLFEENNIGSTDSFAFKVTSKSQSDAFPDELISQDDVFEGETSLEDVVVHYITETISPPEPSIYDEVWSTLSLFSSSEGEQEKSPHPKLEDSFPTAVPVHQSGSSDFMSSPSSHVSPDLLVRDASVLSSMPARHLISSGSIHEPTTVDQSSPSLRMRCCCVTQNVSTLSTSYLKVIQTLKVNKSTLSSARRKLVSVRDDRPSSQTIGCLGLIFITLTLLCMVLADLTSFFSMIKKCV